MTHTHTHTHAYTHLHTHLELGQADGLPHLCTDGGQAGLKSRGTPHVRKRSAHFSNGREGGPPACKKTAFKCMRVFG